MHSVIDFEMGRILVGINRVLAKFCITPGIESY